MTTRDQYVAYVQRAYEDVTQETVNGGWPLQFSDDFVGAGHTAGVPAAGSPTAGYAWVKKIVGAAPPTVALDSNSVGGTVSATLTSASQAQEAALYFNDLLSFDVTKAGMVEFRAALAVLPTGVAGAALGVGSAWVSGGFLKLRALSRLRLGGQRRAANLCARRRPIGGERSRKTGRRRGYHIRHQPAFLPHRLVEQFRHRLLLRRQPRQHGRFRHLDRDGRRQLDHADLGGRL